MERWFKQLISVTAILISTLYVYARIGQWILSEYDAKFDPQGLENSAQLNYWTPENPTNDYPRPNASRSKASTPFISSLGFRTALL